MYVTIINHLSVSGIFAMAKHRRIPTAEKKNDRKTQIQILIQKRSIYAIISLRSVLKTKKKKKSKNLTSAKRKQITQR